MSEEESIEQFEKHIHYNHNDLFRPGSNYEMNACVGNNGGPYDFEDYSRGYFDSGERLFKSIAENNNRLDVLVYPLVYVYRHAIELGLKHLMKVLPNLFEETDSVKYTHNLNDNWESVKIYLLRIQNEFDTYFNDGDTSIVDTTEHVGKVIRDLIEIDSNAQSFRFPQSIKGDNSLEEISHINVEVFYYAMKEVEKCFEYWFEMLDVIWDDYQDYRYYLS